MSTNLGIFTIIQSKNGKISLFAPSESSFDSISAMVSTFAAQNIILKLPVERIQQAGSADQLFS